MQRNSRFPSPTLSLNRWRNGCSEKLSDLPRTTQKGGPEPSWPRPEHSVLPRVLPTAGGLSWPLMVPGQASGTIAQNCTMCLRSPTAAQLGHAGKRKPTQAAEPMSQCLVAGSHGSMWPYPEFQPRPGERKFARTKERREREKDGEKSKHAHGWVEN